MLKRKQVRRSRWCVPLLAGGLSAVLATSTIASGAVPKALAPGALITFPDGVMACSEHRFLIAFLQAVRRGDGALTEAMAFEQGGPCLWLKTGSTFRVSAVDVGFSRSIRLLEVFVDGINARQSVWVASPGAVISR